MGTGALAGLKVIDISTIIAGGLASSMMADHGADVCKIEMPEAGDPARHMQPFKQGVSLWHKVAGRNKAALTLKLSDPRGAAILRKMVASADILIENFRPGTLEKWGLGWEALKQINPRLVMVRISGFGQDGPYAERPGFGTIAEAFAGLPERTGFPGLPPLLSSFPMADSVAGLFATFSAMFAIYNRDHGTGQGQVVDIGLYEPLFRLLEDQMVLHDQLGLLVERMGNRSNQAAPRGVYPTSDGRWIALSAFSDRTVGRLLNVIGGEALASDGRFVTNELRIANVEALDAILSEWTASKTEAEALRIFEDAGVVAGAIYDAARIASDPHYLHRENIVTVHDEGLGEVRVPGVVPKFQDTPGEVAFLTAPLGQHNRERYCGEFGISGAEFDRLVADGII